MDNELYDTENEFPVTEADDHIALAPETEGQESYTVKFYFMVEVHDNDSVVLRTADLPSPAPYVVRQATTSDIISTCQRVSTELNNGVIIGAVRETLVAALVPPPEPPNSADQLREALAARGIELSIKDANE
jgi:hypothetical protein